LSTTIRCPFCNDDTTKKTVIKTVNYGSSITRFRRCEMCQYMFETIEIEHTPDMKIQDLRRHGTRQGH